MERSPAAHARARPDALAIVSDDGRIDRACFADRAGRAAAALEVGPGGRVLCSLRNRPEFVEVVFGAAAAGAELIPIPWRSTPEELAYFVADSGAQVLVCEDAAPVPDGIAVLPMSAYRAARDRASPVAADAPPVLRFYTSGTTGRPKAVERERPPPDAYLASVLDALRVLGVAEPDDVHLVCGPLYHAAPLAYAMYALLCGQTVVLPLRFDAARALELIGAERVTWTMMAPVHFLRLLELPDHQRARADVSSVRRVLHGAAPCPPDVKRRIMDLFPGAVWEFYGMTEGRGTLISPEEWLRKPGSVGRPYPGVSLEVRSPEGEVLPPGEVGLVYVRGAGRFAYAGAPDKTARAWTDDAFTVGDMGYLDADGYLFLTDRADDVIITGGSNVYPAEVEAALHAHPAVGDCAVIGVPDDHWGEHVLAMVELASPATPAALIEHCRARLADFKCPREIIVVERLPRDEAGKVRRKDLREPYWRGRARRI